MLLQGGHVRRRHAANGRRHRLHAGPHRPTQGLEIRLGLLDERAVVAQDFHLFHVHLALDQFGNSRKVTGGRLVQRRNHDALERLTYADFLALPQAQHLGRQLTRQRHAGFERLIALGGVARGEIRQVHRHVLAGHVPVKPVHVERRDGRGHQGHGAKAGGEGLVRALLVGVHLPFPEATPAQTHMPIAQFIHHEVLDGAACACGLQRLVRRVHFLHKPLQAAQNPAVDLWPVCVSHLRFSTLVAVGPCIEGQEVVRVVQGPEELPLHLTDARHVKLEVVPRLGVRDHVPPGGVRPVFGQRLKGVHRIAEALGHLLAVFVQHQAVGDHTLVGHLVKHHG